MDSRLDLENWRQEIRQIDAELLQLVARRMQLSLNIGQHKTKFNLPIKDFKVEKQIIERAREAAKSLGLYPALAEDLMSTLIHYSVLRQDELKRELGAGLPQQSRSVLIVGGAGHMGQWFASFYESLGYAVVIHDRKIQREALRYPLHDSIDQGLDAFEFILLTTPMQETNALLKRFSQLKPAATVIEVCSLKTPILDGLQACVTAGVRIASLHPMFGPDTDVLAGKNILFCQHPGFYSEDVMNQHFLQTSAQLLPLPLADHDALMSYVLGAAHLTNLIYAKVLSRSGLSLKTLKKFAGTTFLKQLEVTDRVVAENQDLYFDIQSLNGASPQLLTSLEATLRDFSQAIGQKDKGQFKHLMAQAQSYFQSVHEKEEP